MVLGFDKQKEHFKTILKKDLLGHAYLFSGPEMIGKFNFAKELCFMANGRPSESDPDTLIIEPQIEEGETKIYIEDIRKVKNFTPLLPYYGPFKFIVINNADRLTIEASNSLLKVLEEPNRNTVFILITALASSLPQTICSRCQEIKFLAHTSEIVSNFLADKKISAKDKEFLVGMAGGRIGWIERVLNDDKIGDIRNAIEEFELVGAKPIHERMAFAKKIADNDQKEELIDYWLKWQYAKMMKNGGDIKLKYLLDLKTVLAQPQYNHRLAIENYLLKL